MLCLNVVRYKYRFFLFIRKLCVGDCKGTCNLKPNDIRGQEKKKQIKLAKTEGKREKFFNFKFNQINILQYKCSFHMVH